MCEYCEHGHENIKNTHFENKPIKAMIYTANNDPGLIIFDRGMTEAVFDIIYCPMCGRKLEVEDGD